MIMRRMAPLTQDFVSTSDRSTCHVLISYIRCRRTHMNHMMLKRQIILLCFWAAFANAACFYTLKAPSNSCVQDIYVYPGDLVKYGDPLLRVQDCRWLTDEWVRGSERDIYFDSVSLDRNAFYRVSNVMVAVNTAYGYENYPIMTFERLDERFST